MRRNLLLSIVLLLTVSLGFSQRQIIVNSPAGLAGVLVSGHGTGGAAGWTGQLFRPGQILTGDVAIAIDSTKTDSLERLRCCTRVSNAAAVRGKIALIRRGDCNFSLKTQNAQAAGAIAVLAYTQSTAEAPFDPGGGTADITIPFGMVGFEDGQKIIAAIRAGQTVNVSFRQPAVLGHAVYSNLSLPQKEVTRDSGGIAIRYANPDVTVQTGFILKAEVRTPSNRNLVLTSNPINVPADDSVRTYAVKDTFTPNEVGTYYFRISNNKTRDTINDSLRVSRHTFAEDRGGRVFNNWQAVDTASYISAGRTLDIGHFYYTGASADKATHGSFSLANPAIFPRGEGFVINLFLVTNDILTKFNAGTLSYSDLPPVGTAIYEMKGTEKPYDNLFAEFQPAVTLTDNALYLMMVRYDGSTRPSNNQPPQYAVSGRHSNPFYWDDVVVAWNGTRNQFYGGWSSGDKNIARLHMAGFLPTDTKDLPVWTDNRINVYPNPTSDLVTLDFNLEKVNKEVEIVIVDVVGNVVLNQKLRDVQTLQHQINVSNLANGSYFAKVKGQDGWKVKVFQVMR